MRKLFALFICAMLIGGNLAVWHSNAAASRRNDERAENLMRQARAAIGGAEAADAVRNLIVSGKLTHTVRMPNEPERTLDGSLEMVIEMPNRLSKKVTLGVEQGQAAPGMEKKTIVKRADVLVHRAPGAAGDPTKFKVKIGGESAETTPDKIRAEGGEHRNDELARLMLGLLLKSPADATFNSGGDGTVDGVSADIVTIENGNGFAAKIYLDKQSHLPLMMTWRGARMQPRIVIRKDGEPAISGAEKDALARRVPEGEEAATADAPTRVIVRRHLGDAPTGDKQPFRASLDEAEFQLRFADYRPVGNLLLPHRLTQIVNNQTDETTTIETYEINAPNIAENFKQSEVRVMRKPEQN